MKGKEKKTTSIICGPVDDHHGCAWVEERQPRTWNSNAACAMQTQTPTRCPARPRPERTRRKERTRPDGCQTNRTEPEEDEGNKKNEATSAPRNKDPTRHTPTVAMPTQVRNETKEHAIQTRTRAIQHVMHVLHPRASTFGRTWDPKCWMMPGRSCSLVPLLMSSKRLTRRYFRNVATSNREKSTAHLVLRLRCPSTSSSLEPVAVEPPLAAPLPLVMRSLKLRRLSMSLRSGPCDATSLQSAPTTTCTFHASETTRASCRHTCVQLSWSPLDALGFVRTLLVKHPDPSWYRSTWSARPTSLLFFPSFLHASFLSFVRSTPQRLHRRQAAWSLDERHLVSFPFRFARRVSCLHPHASSSHLSPSFVHAFLLHPSWRTCTRPCHDRDTRTNRRSLRHDVSGAGGPSSGAPVAPQREQAHSLCRVGKGGGVGCRCTLAPIGVARGGGEGHGTNETRTERKENRPENKERGTWSYETYGYEREDTDGDEGEGEPYPQRKGSGR